MSNDEELRIQMENDLRKLKEKLKKDPADPLPLMVLRMKYPFNSSSDSLKSLLINDDYDLKTLSALLLAEYRSWNQKHRK